MFHAFRDAIIAQVRAHVAEGDCPTKPAYNSETLEHVILDLADQTPVDALAKLFGCKPDEVEDELAEIIGDSIDMDWSSSVGAKAIMRRLALPAAPLSGSVVK